MTDPTFVPDPAQPLEAQRVAFAQYVVDLASQSRTNKELLARLTDSLPADFLALIGEGSTRRTYATPLGICVKVQREDVVSDPLSEAELEERGGDPYLSQLGYRRRLANVSEMVFAACHPKLMPRQYGFLSNFGFLPPHPSVIITETCRPLDLFLPNDGHGIETEDMGIDEQGQLWIFDSRLTSQKRPAHLTPFESMAGKDETVIWLGNLAVSADGKYVLIDRSDHAKVAPILTPWLTLSEWGWTLNGTPAQNLEFSKVLLTEYQQAANPKKGD